ncbi:MAG: hypothetical protein JWL63_3392 [Rhodocyclales bacterium]|nr:hypothetical protein [Rhodocyclales bacterium]
MTTIFLHRAYSRVSRLLPLLLLVPLLASATGMGTADAFHLLGRTGFTPNPDEIGLYAALPREAAVDRILAGVGTRAVTPYPESVIDEAGSQQVRLSEAQRRDFVADQRFRTYDLRAWWLSEMLQTPSPLTERMTLFWHNHFVSSEQKVRLVSLMRDQNQLFRENALGNFAKLLHAASKDPAMVIYLDAASNRKERPNENFAREVMELFTLGEGHYSEQDIKEAARAFTGWSVERRDGRFVYRRALHDDGEKTIFGKTGRFDGDDVLDLLLARRETSEFLVAKLWREFVSPQIDRGEVERIAKILRDEHYEMKPALQALFLSKAFWDADNRAALVKSPVELVVGSLRALQITVPDPSPFIRTLRVLGQDLFAPPNVKGWPGNDVWINASTLLERKQFLDRLARAEEFGSAAPRQAPRAIDRPPGPPSAPAAEAASQRSAFVIERTEALRQRAVVALRDIRLEPKSWSESLARSGLDMQSALLATAPVVPVAMGTQPSLRTVLLDAAYEVK